MSFEKFQKVTITAEDGWFRINVVCLYAFLISIEVAVFKNLKKNRYSECNEKSTKNVLTFCTVVKKCFLKT